MLESGGEGARRRSAGESKPRRPRAAAASSSFSGPHASAGPYEDEDGTRYVVRLERVPGGVRLAEWAGSQLRVRAPVLDIDDLHRLVAATEGVLAEADARALASALATEADRDREAGAGVSGGRSGDFREELRVEPFDGHRVRIGRWLQRPGAGWELREAAPMLPASRFADALADAASAGLLGGRASESPG